VNPKDLLYAETHEWVRVASDKGEKVATIGITAFAVEALTDLVFIQLPDVGKTVAAGKPFGEIESVKAVSDLYSPVDGEVIAVNTKLPDSLGILNTDPYKEGWMVKVRISDESGLARLMDATAYEKQCAEAGH
jgi:glycine cleavage system H protein